MRVDELLNQYYDSFSENEKYVCSYLSTHYPECAASSIGEFAQRCHVSKSLLIRFSKKLGLSGYSELKSRIKLEQMERFNGHEDLLDMMVESYHKMMEELLKIDFSNLFAHLYAAKRVYIYASGSSQSRVASEMQRIFLPAKEMFYFYGHDVAPAVESVAKKEDLVFILSLHGKSEVVIHLAKALQKKGVPTVSITKMKNNTLAYLCQENLYIHTVRLSSPNEVEWETTTPYFILIEFLYLSYQNYLSSNVNKILESKTLT